MDPPYGLKMAAWDEKAWGINELYVLLANLEQLNSNVNATFVCFCSHEMKQAVLEAIHKSCYIEAQCVTWWKGNKAGHGKRFLPSTELMIFAWRSGRQMGYWNYPKESLELRNDCWKEPHVGNSIYICAEDGLAVNPCQKPQSLLRRIIRHHTPGAGLVLDLCAGSHALMMAFISEGRSCISIESDERQHNAAVQIVQAKIDAVVSSNEKEAKAKDQRKEKEDKEKEKKNKAALQKTGEELYQTISTPLGRSKRAATFESAQTSSAGKGPEEVSLDEEESEDIDLTCAKCARGSEDGVYDLVNCLNCGITMHKSCHWSSVTIKGLSENGSLLTDTSSLVYLCKLSCWINKGFSASHVPAPAPADDD